MSNIFSKTGLRNRIKELNFVIGNQREQIKNQQEKIERYEKTLSYYANKENYECDDETLNPAVSYIHIVDMDEGYKARKSLGIETD